MSQKILIYAAEGISTAPPAVRGNRVYWWYKQAQKVDLQV